LPVTERESTYPCFEGTGGYPQGKRRLQFEWPAVWSPDSAQVAIKATDEGRGDGQLLLVRNVNGAVAELEMPSKAGGSGEVSWDGTELIVRSGRLQWKMLADRSGFVKIAK
jgi:hypothetical protein